MSDEPIDEEFHTLCCVIGLMILTWTYAENGLVFMLKTIIEQAGPIKGHPQAPLSLKRRLGAFKTALHEVPALQMLQHDGGALAVRFSELGKRRNELVHGAALSLEEGGFEAVLPRVDGGNYTIENKRVDVRDAVFLQAEITELSFDVADFMARVDAAFGA